jgi:hypothetical protein
VAAEAGDFAVLELPTGWRNGARVLGKSDTLIMMQQLYQSAHGKRRLGGNTSRNPAYKFQYFSETPIMADLIALMNADRPHLTPTLAAEYLTLAARVRAHAPQLFELLNIRYVTVHVEKSPEPLLRLVEEALPIALVGEWQGPDWTGAPSTIRLYRVEMPTTSSPLMVDFASTDAQMYLAEGWSPRGAPRIGRYATRPRVELLLPASPDDAQITLTYGQPVRVAYSMQGAQIAQEEGNVHTLSLPLSTYPEATMRLTLDFLDAPISLAELVSQPTPIGNTGHSLDHGVALFVQSAGEEVGDFAHIWVNGVQQAEGGRGYHLVAMTRAGEILARATFDTMVAEESTRMAAWLNGWPEGTIVAGAVEDSAATEASDAWDSALLPAMARLGVAGDLRGRLRWSHAFVGVVGAAPGSAWEEVTLIMPATVWLGAPLPAVAGYGPLQSLTLLHN